LIVSPPAANVSICFLTHLLNSVMLVSGKASIYSLRDTMLSLAFAVLANVLV